MSNMHVLLLWASWLQWLYQYYLFTKNDLRHVPDSTVLSHSVNLTLWDLYVGQGLINHIAAVYTEVYNWPIKIAHFIQEMYVIKETLLLYWSSGAQL